MILLWALVSWQQVFALPAREPSVHVRAHYVDAAGTHTLELWRDGDRRLRRDTDGKLSLWAQRRGGDFDYHLADRNRKMLVHVAGGNLHRIGVFQGWNELAHIVVRPHGDVAVERRGSGRGCRWYRIGARDLCWSARYALPLVIEEAGRVVFTIDELSPGHPDSRVFELPSGMAEIDANDDLDPSID